MLDVATHPLLDLGALISEFAAPLGEIDPPAELAALRSASATAPMSASDDVRAAVRAMLRHAGFKPSGRSKPSSEYLLRAAGEAPLTVINVAVDIANVVSLHSGLPISVVDLDRAQLPLRVAVAAPGSSYVFNPSGQEIDVGSLLCLADAQGPCANAVKDAQRTKTGPATRRTLTLVWGSTALDGRTAAVAAWLREWLASVGARVSPAT